LVQIIPILSEGDRANPHCDKTSQYLERFYQNRAVVFSQSKIRHIGFRSSIIKRTVIQNQNNILVALLIDKNSLSRLRSLNKRRNKNDNQDYNPKKVTVAALLGIKI
jgi:hypothetical protein